MKVTKVKVRGRMDEWHLVIFDDAGDEIGSLNIGRWIGKADFRVHIYSWTGNLEIVNATDSPSNHIAVYPVSDGKE